MQVVIHKPKLLLRVASMLPYTIYPGSRTLLVRSYPSKRKILERRGHPQHSVGSVKAAWEGEEQQLVIFTVAR